MNPPLQSKSNIDWQEHPHTLETAPNNHNPQTLIFINSADTTYQMNFNIYSQGPIFLTAASLDATTTPQSNIAPPLTSHFGCINNTSYLPFTLPINDPPILPNLFSSPLTSFSSTQSLQAVDVIQN